MTKIYGNFQGEITPVEVCQSVIATKLAHDKTGGVGRRSLLLGIDYGLIVEKLKL